jgi:AmmeMemoRadiSam system protein A
MSLLAEREKQFLLETARRALALAVERGAPLEDIPLEEATHLNLSDVGGAFVTLRRHRRLRGCIGQLASDLPLAHVVAYCARAAALDDPRFDPVAAHELGEIDIELSVLSLPRDVTPTEIEPGRHGLIVSMGSRRGLLLPQVAREYCWSSQHFLEETCVKGGFDRNAWQIESTRIQAFTAEVFSEAGFQRDNQIRPSQSGRPGYSSST